MNKIKKIISFYVLTNSLKEKIRSGWKSWNISAERLESVAEHIYGTCMLAIAIDSEYDLDIDIRKVVLMLTMHEIEEIRIGDLTPFDRVTPEQKREMGKKAVKEILNGLVKEEEYYNLIQEFDDCNTNEAIFARMCDKLEADLQCKIYTERGEADIHKIECENLLQDERIIKLMNNGANKLSDLFVGFDMPIYIKEEFKQIAEYIKDNNIIKGE